MGLDAAEPLDESTPAQALTITEADAGTMCSWCAEQSLLALDMVGEDVYLANQEQILHGTPSLSALAEVLRGKTLICYDCKTLYKYLDAKMLAEEELFDLMLGAYLVNPSKGNYTPEMLVADHLGKVLSESLPRIAYFLPLYEEIRRQLEESGQLELLQTLEMPLGEVLADMEMAGFSIDRAGIAAFGEQLGNVASALEAQIYFHAGKEFNIQSPKQLGEVLFDTL